MGRIFIGDMSPRLAPSLNASTWAGFTQKTRCYKALQTVEYGVQAIRPIIRGRVPGPEVMAVGRVHFWPVAHTLPSDQELLEAMIGAAIGAGRVAYDIYRRGFDVQYKADTSPVTSADHAAEALILERLARCAPGAAVVAEEEVAAGRVPARADEFFLVDPLDGTKEFIER